MDQNFSLKYHQDHRNLPKQKKPPNMANPNFVRVKNAVLVSPSAPTPSKTLSLSALDSQLFLRFTIEYLLVYRPRPGSDQTAILAGVKAALGRALVPYYPLAGRVRSKSTGSGLEVVCRAQGALFVEAVSNLTISEFERAPKFVEQWRKFLTVHVDDVLQGAPSLVMQLTWLKDGTAALGVGINHCICDGIGSAEFLNSFAAFATQNDFKPKPVWNRHLLDPVSPKSQRVNSVSHYEFNRVPDLCNFNSCFSNERLTPTSMIFEKIQLNELKKLASSTSRLSDRPSSSYSSFDVLSAHIWRSWARALKFPPNQILKLLFSINVRNRVKPSLPTGFYGNAFVLGCAQASVKDLVGKGLGYAAALVHRAKERVNDEFVKSVVESVTQERASPDLVGVLILSQWSSLGLENVDFGLDRPVHVGPVCCDKYCLILPVYNRTDAVKVMVAVPTSGVNKFEYLLRIPCS